MRGLQERRAFVTTLSAPDRPTRSRVQARRTALILAVASVVVAVDQVTKTWAENQPLDVGQHVFGPLWLWPTLNPGAAFGLGRGVTPVIEAVVVVLVAALLVLGRRASRQASVGVAVALGLLFGGAVGNLVDRVIRANHGSVIDFIDIARIGHRDWWPTFNVADSCIVVGAIVLVLCYRHRSPAAATDAR